MIGPVAEIFVVDFATERDCEVASGFGNAVRDHATARPCLMKGGRHLGYVEGFSLGFFFVAALLCAERADP